MANWRVGRFPIHVYDGDTPICTCHTPEQAARIVAAVNAEEEMKLLRGLESQIRDEMKVWKLTGPETATLKALDALRKERDGRRTHPRSRN